MKSLVMILMSIAICTVTTIKTRAYDWAEWTLGDKIVLLGFEIMAVFIVVTALDIIFS